eukprot:2264060-Pleurochrysis_carterae.AAC.2
MVRMLGSFLCLGLAAPLFPRALPPTALGVAHARSHPYIQHARSTLRIVRLVTFGWTRGFDPRVLFEDVVALHEWPVLQRPGANGLLSSLSLHGRSDLSFKLRAIALITILSNNCSFKPSYDALILKSLPALQCWAATDVHAFAVLGCHQCTCFLKCSPVDGQHITIVARLPPTS